MTAKERVRGIEVTRRLRQDYAAISRLRDRLERKAGNQFRPGEDGPPDRIDDLYDQLEEPEEAAKVISAISPTDAGWLVRRIRKQLEKDQENLMDEIEKELAVSYHSVIGQYFAEIATSGHLSS